MFLPFYYPFCLLARVFPVIVPWHLPAAINMKIMCNRRDAKRVLWLTKVSITWLAENHPNWPKIRPQLISSIFVLAMLSPQAKLL